MDSEELEQYITDKYSDELAIKNRIRELVQDKIKIRGYGLGTKKGARHNPWLEFVKKERKKDNTLSLSELSIMYKKKKGCGLSVGGIDEDLNIEFGGSLVGGVANKWTHFLHKNKNKGYTRKQLQDKYYEELSKQLKAEKKRKIEANKKSIAKKKAVAKKTAVKKTAVKRGRKKGGVLMDVGGVLLDY